MSRTPPSMGGLRGYPMGGGGAGRGVNRIRRVQSERLPFHPRLGSASGPSLPPALPPPRLDYQHLHHHAPRTAVIPPMASRPPTTRLPTIRSYTPGANIWAQLPPMALGSAPPKDLQGVGMGVPVPPLTINTQLGQDKLLWLLQEEPLSPRPSSAASCPESPLYESLASNNNSSDDDVTLSEEETENPYQKIRPLVSRSKSKSIPRIEGITRRGKEDILFKPVNKFDRTRSLSHLQKEENIIWLPVKELPKVEHNKQRKPVMRCQSQRQPSHEKLHRLKTLDIMPDKKSKKSDSSEDELSRAKCICKRSKSSAVRRSSSTVSRITRIPSQQSLSSHYHNKHTALNSKSDVSSSKITINNMNDHSPQTTVKSNSSRSISSSHDDMKMNKKHSTKSLGIKYSPTFSPGDRLYKIKNYASTSCLLSNNLNISNSSHSSSSNISKVQISRHPTLEMNIPPRTIEIPEVRRKSRKQENVHTTANKSTQVYIEAPKPKKSEAKIDTPYERRRNYLKTQQTIKENQQVSNVMKTLDPRKSSQVSKSTSTLNVVSHNIPETQPLVVNFESEYPTSDDDEEFSELMLDFDSDDTESIHGTAAELCSLIAPDNDSFVYIYQGPPPSQQSNSHKEDLATIRNHQRTYRDRSTYGSSGGSCDSEGSWGSGSSDNDHYNRSSGGSSSNLSVGARGHLKIDYSCSWDNLDDFVRTSPKGLPTSPKGGYSTLRKGHPTSHMAAYPTLPKRHPTSPKANNSTHDGVRRMESILQAKVKLEAPHHYHNHPNHHHRLSATTGSSSVHRRPSMRYNGSSPQGAAVTAWERYQLTSSVAV